MSIQTFNGSDVDFSPKRRYNAAARYSTPSSLHLQVRLVTGKHICRNSSHPTTTTLCSSQRRARRQRYRSAVTGLLFSSRLLNAWQCIRYAYVPHSIASIKRCPFTNVARRTSNRATVLFRHTSSVTRNSGPLDKYPNRAIPPLFLPSFPPSFHFPSLSCHVLPFLPPIPNP